MKFKKIFLDYCKIKGLEINNNQIETVKAISKFYQNNFDNNLFSSLFLKKKDMPGFLI